MAGPWPSPFLIALAVLSVPYLVQGARRGFRRDLNSPSAGVPETAVRLARFERLRTYALGGGVILLSLPWALTLLVRPPVPRWLALTVVAIPLVFFAAGIALSFIIGWHGGWPGSGPR